MYSQLSDLDRRMLEILIDTEGTVPTHELSKKLEVPLSTVQRRRRRLEQEYIIKHYSIDPTRFGYRKIDLLIHTEGGATMDVGKTLLKRDEVMSVVRTIGEHVIDLRVEIFVKNNSVLLDILEEVKAMQGVKDVIWTEEVETIGRKGPPNHLEIIRESGNL